VKFSVVKNLFASQDKTLLAKSMLAVKFFFDSSRFEVKRRVTGPSKLLKSNRSAVRVHS
jgi:hypothetical protein